MNFANIFILRTSFLQWTSSRLRMHSETLTFKLLNSKQICSRGQSYWQATFDE